MKLELFQTNLQLCDPVMHVEQSQGLCNIPRKCQLECMITCQPFFRDKAVVANSPSKEFNFRWNP